MEFIIDPAKCRESSGIKERVKTALDPIFWRLSQKRLIRIGLEQSPGRVYHEALQPIGLAHYKWLRANQVASEFTQLLSLVKELAPRRTVEIGVEMGGTFLCWSRLTTEALLGIDWPEDIHHFKARRKMWPLVMAGGPVREVTMFAGDSHGAVARDLLHQWLGDQTIDFAFVDGDHSTAGVRQDYELLRPHMRRGGLMAFHDIVVFPTEDRSGVYKFWQDICRRERVFELIENRDQGWGGIGVIRC